MPEKPRRRCQHSDEAAGPLFARKCGERALWAVPEQPQALVFCTRHMLLQISNDPLHNVRPVLCDFADRGGGGFSRFCRGWQVCQAECERYCRASGPRHWSHVVVVRRLRRLRRRRVA
jgi:hypothetical protein